MSYDDEETPRRGIAGTDPLPPSDWEGYGRGARLEALYAAERPRLTGYFRRNARQQDVGDLVQECFRRLVSAKGHLAGNLEKPGGYLIATARTILRNRARTHVRREQGAHHSFEEQDVAGPDPHIALEARDMIRRIEDALAGLDSTTRDIFLMHRFDDLSYPEIARIKGMRVKRVEKHIAKALIAIRKARDAQP